MIDGNGDIQRAPDWDHVPSGLAGQVDLCIHVLKLRPGGLPALDPLKAGDAILAPHGRQIVVLDDTEVGWHAPNRRLHTGFVLQWLRGKGWPEVSPFVPEDHLGKGSSDFFSCRSSGSMKDEVFVLPKIPVLAR
jgi:hypothetical protein